MKNISKEDVQNFLKTFDTETCTIIGDFYCEDIILEGRKSMKTIIADAIIAVDNILGSTSKVAWKNEEKIDFTEYFDYWRKMKKELLILTNKINRNEKVKFYHENHYCFICDVSGSAFHWMFRWKQIR